MGMFSWECNGCSEELCATELVRINGYVGNYDGYGRCDGYDPMDGYGPIVCWHERCFQLASDKDQKENKPSEHAKNQGFGPAKLKFVENYDENAKTTFWFHILVESFLVESFFEKIKEDYYLVKGELKDLEEHLRKFELANTNHKLWEDRYELNEEFYNLVQRTIESEIGSIHPERNRDIFEDYEQVRDVADRSLGKLVRPELGYELYIFGDQAKASGLVYWETNLPDIIKTDNGWQRTGDMKREVLYDTQKISQLGNIK